MLAVHAVADSGHRDASGYVCSRGDIGAENARNLCVTEGTVGTLPFSRHMQPHSSGEWRPPSSLEGGRQDHHVAHTCPSAYDGDAA